MALTLSIQYLLSAVSEINKKYEEIARITGENFNIFSVLKLQSDEVRLHSRLLGELLNPNGSHGKNELFLELFLSTLNLQSSDYTQEQIKNAIVTVEENIGNIPDDYSKGGRIDLVIKFRGNKEIVIENKIYAGDQFNQLGRYHEQYPNAHIVYLTPLERKPSKESIGEKLKLEQVKCITYKNEIKKWLELCHEKTSNFPMLRETITQYIFLIKHITNQTMNENMKDDIIKKIISNSESIAAAESIFNNWESCQFKIIDLLKTDIKTIANNLPAKITFDDERKLGEAETGFWFYKENDVYCIYFFFEVALTRILVGVSPIDSDKISENFNSKKQEIIQRLPNNNLAIGEKYKDWLYVKEFMPWSDTKWSEILKEIPNEIEKEVIELYDLLDQEPKISLQ